MKRAGAYLSVGAGLFLFAVYWLRPDWATAATIFPAWSWLILWALSIPARRHWSFKIASLLWLVFALTFVEEIRSLSKSCLPTSDQTADLKVITINCSGSIRPLLLALEEAPDIILIQETPQSDVVNEWVEANEAYAYAHGIDTSILVKGNIRHIGAKGFFYNTVFAEIDGVNYHLTSLRLATSNPRIDLWNSDCWAKQRAKREQQIEQISEITRAFPPSRENYRVILGGDFNVPQGDRVFSKIDDKLVDSFASGGRGWCNTIMDSIPLLRIDQIWTSPNMRSTKAFAQRVDAADHRMYVAELNLN